MSQLRMTDAGDIYVGANRFSLVDRRAEIRQRLIQNLRTFFGECFLDTTKGLAYHQVIFEKGTPQTVIESLIIDEILKTTGVTNLTRFEPLDLDPKTRTLTVDFEVATVFGTIAVEEVLAAA
jgi:hypothetical protein